ncbi:S-layer homology domain-containing protein [Psychrobacillus sp. FSL H8-0484]|uniref:S-layer homology domain-containing protein n=1 Tax=Psychrobacillus sp. FSL H8-0484 TaxID=2921390 RepID=UPI0030F727BE
MKKLKMKTILLMMTLLLFIPSITLQVNAANLYKDINKDYWAYSSIVWANKKGIMKGYPDGTFGPTKAITESQLVSVLSKFDTSFKATGSYITKPGEPTSAGYYRYFKSKNMPVNGYTNTKKRDKAVTRGQFARIIAAADGLNLTEPYAVQYFYSQNLSSGSSGKKTYEDFNPAKALTRADATVFLNRLANRGTFKISGINGTIFGSDNVAIDKPTDFPDTGTIVFPGPSDKEPDKKPVSPTYDSRLADMDIQHPTLIANGVDSSFITLILKDCYGNTIPYDQSIPFVVTSKLGATITGEQGGKWTSSTTLYTDGPDISAQITALKSTKSLNDTISFKISDNNSTGVNMACYKNPVSVQISYDPQAELRIEHEVFNKDSFFVKASIVRPGGQIITDYNGKVRFDSAQLSFSNNEVSFVNGVARTSIKSYPWGDSSLSAKISQSDARYTSELTSILNKFHSHEINVDRPLYADYSCPRDFEVGFIIDSSGSMKRSDPSRLRVSKSQELISALNAPTNVGAHFDSKGYLLGKGSPSFISSTFNQVRQAGGTNIADGLDKAFDSFSTGNTPKIAILLTDGKSSPSKIVSLIKEARDRNITVYTIGLGDKKFLNEELLEQIANSTGGSYYHVAESTDIAAAYQAILDEITCETHYPSCSYYDQGFLSPTIKSTRTNFYMNTFISENCGEVARVIVQFTSLEGNIDYELIYRGQNYYALEKEIHEITDLTLFTEGTFIAYDSEGNKIGEKTITIK